MSLSCSSLGGRECKELREKEKKILESTALSGEGEEKKRGRGSIR